MANLPLQNVGKTIQWEYMLQTALNWKITAKAGDGVMLSSSLFAKLCKRHGMQAFNYYEYPSLIKGGLQSGQVYASYEAATCQRRHPDLLLLFHESLLPAAMPELTAESVVILNTQSFDPQKYPDLKAKVVPMNLSKISREQTGSLLATNMVALGVSATLFGMELRTLGEVINDEFAKKKTVLAANLKAVEAACQLTKEMIEQGQLQLLGNFEQKSDEQILLSGNEAVGLGALAAGLQFYAAYPMTPASALLHYLAEQQSHYPLVVKHVEDEIAAINQALGASFTGVRAMTGSSGGGFALMVEALSFAGIAEIPLVILEGTRQGPATGLPTWTSQGDLNFVLGAGHGDFLRVILSPSDVAEHFALTKLAFDLAEKFQLPVFVLSDKQILESQMTMPKPEVAQHNQRQQILADGQLGEVGVEAGSYKRYADTESGVSPRSIPGQAKALQLTNSYEHDQFGFATEDQVIVKQAVEKRARKLAALLPELPPPVYIGDEDPEKIFLAFGSTIGVLKELLRLKPAEQKIGVINLPCLYPFPTAALNALLKGKKAELWTMEGNATGQLAALIQREVGLTALKSLLRYDGRPFYVEDLLPWLAGQPLNQQYVVL